MRQSGTLRTNTETERWMTFDAEHLVVPPATGFLWNARVQLAPLLHVRVRDALIEGSGAGRVALLSAFTVSAADGGARRGVDAADEPAVTPFPGGFRQAPWQGHFSDYRERQGMLVPTHGEVGWYIDDEWRTVWKGTISAYDARHRSPS